ncbi:MAG: DNA cytosine methyltransferase [Thermoplasmata archaeon]
MKRQIVAVDLFCGAGGLTRGLLSAGVRVVAGVDLDPDSRYPYEHNNKVRFIEADVSTLSARRIRDLYPKNSIKVLVGCTPCTPYSTLKNGRSPRATKGWQLLDQFARLVKGVRPHIVTMENVPKLRYAAIFRRFVRRLRDLGYHVDAQVLKAELYGVPQRRRRLVLVASRLGAISVPRPRANLRLRTVRDSIGLLPRLTAGALAKGDRLHRAAGLRVTNKLRIRASVPGGSWKTWRRKLRLQCHSSRKGRRFTPVYGRMRWDRPAPTITTQAYNYGSGRFGHPGQARAISLREAALLQTFPRRYQFTRPGETPSFRHVGRLIGNAVPVRLGERIGRSIVGHARCQLGD